MTAPLADAGAVTGVPPSALTETRVGNWASRPLRISVKRRIVCGEGVRQLSQAGWSAAYGATQAVADDLSKALEARYAGRFSSRPEEMNDGLPVPTPTLVPVLARRSRAESGAVGETVARPLTVHARGAGG